MVWLIFLLLIASSPLGQLGSAGHSYGVVMRSNDQSNPQTSKFSGLEAALPSALAGFLGGVIGSKLGSSGILTNLFQPQNPCCGSGNYGCCPPQLPPGLLPPGGPNGPNGPNGRFSARAAAAVAARRRLDEKKRRVAAASAASAAARPTDGIEVDESVDVFPPRKG